MGCSLGEQQLRVGQRITGVLDPHLVAGREKHADRDVDRLLGAGRDDDLFGIAVHRARCPQIVADVAAQLDQASGIGIAKVVRAEPAHGAMG
jgi:hypothetical protein